MNVSDSEIVASILESSGYAQADTMETADVIMINTCAIREGAEQKIWRKLESLYGAYKKRRPGTKIGVLGCMAERVK